MRPKKSLGQNFLLDRDVISRIVAALTLSSEDTVIEIGPGRGALTEGLVVAAGQVIAVEFDRDLIDGLRDRFAEHSNFRVVNEDALQTDFGELTPARGLKLAANLPYNISTPILQRLIDQRGNFEKLVLMFQREVADRVTASPGNSDRGYLSVLVEEAFQTERLFDVPPKAFYPVPKVWSSVIRLTPTPKTAGDSEQFRSLLKLAFAQKRKTLNNNLRPHFSNLADRLVSVQIDGQRRAETLRLAEWKTLAAALYDSRK